MKPVPSRSPTIHSSNPVGHSRSSRNSTTTWVCQADSCCLCKCFRHLTLVTTWCPDFPGLTPPSHSGFLARFLLSKVAFSGEVLQVPLNPHIFSLPTHSSEESIQSHGFKYHEIWGDLYTQMLTYHFLSDT